MPAIRSMPRSCDAATLSTAAVLILSVPLGAQRPAVSLAAPQQTSARATRVASVEGITEYVLPNGLRVLLFPDQSKPTVTVNITYLVGSRHEGYGETGMAHLLEHLVFKGSKSHPNIPQELTDHGSRPNGTTWFDRTNYFETVPANDTNLAWALDLEADRMVNSFIARKDLESEFSVVRNELESGENSPFGVTSQRLSSAAYLWHGYGRSTIGNRSDIEGVPIERLQAFYRKWYQPDNAVLVVAGKFEPARTLALIENKFGRNPRPKRSLEAGNLLFATYTKEPTQDGLRSVEVRRVGDIQLLAIGHHIPAGSHPDYAALNVLQFVLTDNPSGYIYKALVDTKLAASVGGGAWQFKEPGLLVINVQMRKEHSLDSSRVATTAILDRARSIPFSDAEIERAKNARLRGIQLLLNNSEFVGLTLTEWAAMGDWRLFFLHRDRIAAVTAADVRRVAAQYLKAENRTIATFIPTATPDRAEIPATPNIAALVADYKGGAVVQAGEAFDASAANIDSRTKHSMLPNGMHVTLLQKQTRGDRVVAQITLRQGTEQALNGKVQVGSFVNALLSRGTTQLSRQQVKDSTDKLRAQVFFGGATNNTVVSIETIRENVIPVLELVAHQLKSPAFDAAEFEKLKTERLSGIEASKSEPQVLASVALNRRLLPKPRGHMLYSSTPDELIEDVKAVTIDQVRAFHRDFFGASYADIAFVGDFDPDQISSTVARLFGAWTNPQPFARLVRAYVATDSSSETIQTPDKANAAFLAAALVEMRDDDADYPAMVLANFMLGGGFLNSRLPVRLRQKEGISYGVGTNFAAQAQDRYATFQTSAIYAPQNVERLLTGFREELDRARADGFTAQEVDAAKAGYLRGRSQGRANDAELVGLLVARRFVGRTLTSYDEDFEKKVQALTPAAVNAVVRKYIDPSKMVIVRAGDFAKHPPVRVTP